MYTLYQQYEKRKQTGNKRKLFTSNVRKAMGSPFQNKDGEQCALEFISTLLDRLNLIHMFEIIVENRFRCKACDPSYFFNVEYMPILALPFILHNITDFNQFLQDWQPVEGHQCPTCHISSFVESNFITIQMPDNIIIEIRRHIPGKPVNRNKIQNFNCNNTKIGPHHYRVVGAIIHLGEYSHSGHYIALIRTHSYGWLRCNDDLITQVDSFPNDLEDISLIVLEKIPE